MHVGVDFGTTRTVVAFADRGNYPVVSFFDHLGDSFDHFPSVAVVRPDGRLDFGPAALDDRPGVRVRSFKRALAAPDASIDTVVEEQGVRVRLIDLLVGFLSALRAALADDSTLSELIADDPLESVVIAVPAHATSAQRFMTLEAFQRAGFPVVAMMNEPSAAGFEYTHRQERTVTARRTQIIVYDMGGGTFDASLVDVRDHAHEVLDSVGINRLGGDDFDETLVRLALSAAGTSAAGLSPGALAALREQARQAKESLVPQTRRIALDINDRPVRIPVDDFYEAVEPLVLRSIDVVATLLERDGPARDAELAGIYVAGGASALPVVPRMLRTRFGRRVHRAPYPTASTAIGLAIAADPDSGYTLTDRLSRGFGVFRERDNGRQVVFDPIVSRDETLPTAQSLRLVRRYRPVHNVGWFRFAEYSRLDADGQPVGDTAPFGVVLFPIDPALRETTDLEKIPVTHISDAPLIEEAYTVDPNGIVHVDITDIEDGYRRSYWLGQSGNHGDQTRPQSR
ncbi:Molecular chaperone DnaK (HSP70) [Propionibacterium cyclohexanicum]|uniref:Molecular chaperone DnaK (HSP70) n=1 Tax=Propionibacterium cyclohexanicum TaxID=64702 RepID=A0A1H9QQQ1_9ACTN|nr:Hsp70 family protein [Propionibacterium cyclohexanicum]SER62073.1 Molecular chaperone DnaK (HSP70) [Propionibacterium cyclohexanicum]